MNQQELNKIVFPIDNLPLTKNQRLIVENSISVLVTEINSQEKTIAELKKELDSLKTVAEKP